MMCAKPFRIFTVPDYPEGLEVPCGKCYLCRMKRRTEWSARLYAELPYWDRHSFVTLTYQDKDVPKNMSLRKIDLQKFFKRLRKNTNRKLKYYAVGEYGKKTWRPHYHQIIFGIGLQAEDRQIIMDCWPYMDWSIKAIRDSAFGSVTPESIQYVAGYIYDKLSGEVAEDVYDRMGREHVFKTCSQGIGKKFAEDNRTQIQQNGYIRYRGAKIAIPRYYVKKLGLDLSQIKERSAENEIDLVEKLTGIRCNRLEYYKTQSSADTILLEGRIQASNRIKNENIKARCRLFNKKI